MRAGLTLRYPRLRRAAFVLGAVLLLALASLAVGRWAAGMRAESLRHWNAQLSAGAEYRREAIEAWAAGRLGDAVTVSRYSTVVDLAAGHAGPKAARHLSPLLISMQETYGYDEAWVVGGPDGLPALAGPSSDMEPYCCDAARQVLLDGRPRISLHRHGARTRVTAAAPVWPPDPHGAKPLGAVVLAVDPASDRGPAGRLFSLLTREPSPTRTVESLLVKREGPAVVYLSPLRHDPSAPLTLRRSLEATALGARGAMASGPGFREMRDYRGVPVYAAVRPLSMGWELIVKADREEVLEGYRARLWRTGGAAAAALLALLGVGVALWRVHVVSSRLALARSEARYGLLLEQAMDVILFIDADGRFLDANARASDLLGYSRAELVQMRLQDVLPSGTEAGDRLGAARRGVGLLFEAELRTRDGALIPVEASLRSTSHGGAERFLAIVRDTRERQARARQVDQLHRVLRTLYEVSEIRSREPGREDFLADTCRTIVERGGFRMAWVGLLDPEASWLVPVAWAGHEDGYLGEVKVAVDAGPLGRGPGGTAVREKRTVEVPDLEHAEGFGPWREPALRRGYRSLVGSPILSGGEVAGGLFLYSGEAGPLPGPILELVRELAAEIGFALESISAHSEREAAVAARQAATRSLEVLVSAAPLAIFTATLDRRVAEVWNPAAESLFGWSRDEAIGVPLPFVPPDAQATFEAAFQRVLKGEPQAGFDVELRSRQGAPLHVNLSSALLREVDGRASRVLLMAADVSQRRQMEAALRESEARFKRLADNAPDVVFRLRLLPTPAVEYINPGVAVVGLTPEAFYADASLVLRLIHPDDRDIAEAVFRGEPTTETSTVRWIGTDGSVVWTEVRSTAVRDEQGRVVAVEGISRDVTQRVATEETLRKLSAAVEQSPASVVITDLAGAIEYVNPAFTRLTGWSLDEARGRNPSVLQSGHHPRSFYEQLYATLAAGREWHGEFLNRRRSGELFWESAAISTIVDAAGRPTHYLALKQDISDRKETESQLASAREQLLHSQKIEAVGRLAGGVAHDFNNLLGIILGHAEIALPTLPPEHPVRVRLQQILEAARRAADLTRQLLAFSRRQVLQPKVVEINSVVADAERLLRRLIGEDVELVVRLSPEPGLVRVDASQMSQVLFNLGVNSRDAMPGGGALTLETSNVEVDADYARAHPPLSPGAYVQLRVTDTGVGMDDHVRERAFEPFFTTKPEGAGSGLGLAMVYGIVKQSGGFIWVESTPGQGTTFTIHLPLRSGVADSSPVAPPRQGQDVEVGTETVLAVEDQDGLRDLVSEVLTAAGYHVLAARDGREALTLAEAHPATIQLLVTDVVMPGMSGKELADRLSLQRPQMRVLFVSGYTSDVIANYGVSGSSLRLLDKPFTRASLLRAVRDALDGEN